MKQLRGFVNRAPALLIAVCVGAGLAACEDSPATGATAGGPAVSARATASAPASASAAQKPLPVLPKAAPLPTTPQPLPELNIPRDNELTPEKVALGKMLFFDKRLSKDGSASCESCHFADKGWSDGKALSPKVGGELNTRHSPTLINVGYQEAAFYWDGRTPSLEKTVEAAWKNQLKADPVIVAAALGAVQGYKDQFQVIFKGDPSPDSIAKALAAFIRTLRSGDAPWDRYEKGDKAAVGEEAVRGFELFRNKAGCAGCHAPPLYTDYLFHNTGVGFDKPEPDVGRGKITKVEGENGAFKTPTLRSVTTHPPYLHDGRAATIEAAVDFMLAGGIKNPNLDARMKKITLTAKERTDLLAFIKALEAAAPKFEPPTLPQ